MHGKRDYFRLLKKIGGPCASTVQDADLHILRRSFRSLRKLRLEVVPLVVRRATSAGEGCNFLFANGHHEWQRGVCYAQPGDTVLVRMPP